MKKRIFGVIAVVLLVCTLMIALVGCNSADSFEKRLARKDYAVETIEPRGNDKFEFCVHGYKMWAGDMQHVWVYKFPNYNDALVIKADAQKKYYSIYEAGDFLIVGTCDTAVNDAAPKPWLRWILFGF